MDKNKPKAKKPQELLKDEVCKRCKETFQTAQYQRNSRAVRDGEILCSECLRFWKIKQETENIPSVFYPRKGDIIDW